MQFAERLEIFSLVRKKLQEDITELHKNAWKRCSADHKIQDPWDSQWKQ